MAGSTSATVDTSLPDRLERVGVVVGTKLLLSLPMGVVGSLLLAVGWPAWTVAIPVLVPGVVVGVLAATGRIPVSYGQIWSFSLTSWFVTLLVLQAAGLNYLGADQPTVLGGWAVGLLVGAVVASRGWLRERLL
jgi:hypothetical protein